jgi:hypothetical protein
MESWGSKKLTGQHYPKEGFVAVRFHKLLDSKVCVGIQTLTYGDILHFTRDEGIGDVGDSVFV